MTTDGNTTFGQAREALTEFESVVHRLPLESIHRANPILGLVHQLRGRIGEVEEEARAWAARVPS